jgi:small subunit ribosomal protein S17
MATTKTKKSTKAVKKPTVKKSVSKVKLVPDFVTRGRTFIGKVISNKMAKTAKIQWDRRSYLYKYERYQKKRSAVMAHIPEGMNVAIGDTVKIAECKPISKTKKFIIIERVVKNETN